MITPALTATYRVQLRGDVTFDVLRAALPQIAGLGISHLYLSPIFTATAGSTHGYDITRPDQVDPALGGLDGFLRLSEAAQDHGLGIILDIVPNHTAFSLDNPWLREVLRHGQDSRYAAHFDIDWSKGPLVLPYLHDPIDDMLAAGAISLGTAPDGPTLIIGEAAVPLATGPLPDRIDAETLPDLLRAQSWQLTHWEHERDGLSHRRFFNVTGLIGMRVEDAAVFAAMHRLIFDLVERGAVQGLRVDHVDGLADPAQYLDRLAKVVGDTPVWVEKILVGDETLPDWPVLGTTGYEAGAAIARVLTDPSGLATLDQAWRDATGQTATFAAMVAEAKREVIRHDLAGELHDLIRLAQAAMADVDAGDEALREAILALLTAFPRYRTYFDDTPARPDDLAVMEDTVTRAAEAVRSDRVLRALAERITAPADDAARQLQVRFQQVTGALLAKAHEDTAGFRFSRCLAANEVGADPDHATMEVTAFSEWLSARPTGALTLTSSHDTKRSEDARMRLVAVTHLPEAALSLWQAARTLPEAQIDPDLCWYVVQSVLALWDPADPDQADRLATHVEKAMREAKLVTTWSHPDATAEAGPQAFAAALLRSWQAAPPPALDRIIALGRDLSLIQLALKCVMPGIPDIYQGAEGECLALTDPDNRRPVDFAAMPAPGSFAAQKRRATVDLLALRRTHAAFLDSADATARLTAGRFELLRAGPEGRIVLSFAWPPVDRADSDSLPYAVDCLPAARQAAAG